MFDERLTVTRTKSPPYGLILGGGCGIVVLAIAIGALVAYLFHLDGWGLSEAPGASAKPTTSGKVPSSSASGKVKR